MKLVINKSGVIVYRGEEVALYANYIEVDGIRVLDLNENLVTVVEAKPEEMPVGWLGNKYLLQEGTYIVNPDYKEFLVVAPEEPKLTEQEKTAWWASILSNDSLVKAAMEAVSQRS